MAGKTACRSALGGLQFKGWARPQLKRPSLPPSRCNVWSGDSHQQAHSDGPRCLSDAWWSIGPCQIPSLSRSHLAMQSVRFLLENAHQPPRCGWCLRSVRESLGQDWGVKCRAGTWLMKKTTFLRLACQEMMIGGIQLKQVTNVSAGLGADDRRSGIEALRLRQSMASSQCTPTWAHSAAMRADGLTKSSSSAQRMLMEILFPGLLATGARSDMRESAKKRQDPGKRHSG